MDDLFIIIRIYGNEEKFPKEDWTTQSFMQFFITTYYGRKKENFEKHDGFFPNNFSPEDLITRTNYDFKVKKELLDRIYNQKQDSKNYILNQQIYDNEISWKKENQVKTVKSLLNMKNEKLDLKSLISEIYRKPQ